MPFHDAPPIILNSQESHPRNHTPSVTQTPPSMIPFLNHPDFKRLVAQQVDFVCKQAVKSGRIRIIPQNPTPIFIPRMDIVDDPSCPRFVATFELPGVRHNEVTLQIQEGSLVVDGERRRRISPQSQPSGKESLTKNASPDHKVKVPIQELRYGRFRRLIGLPRGTKSSDIVARFQDGMLIVTWPRSSAADTDVEMATPPQSDSGTTSITVPSSNDKQEAT